jgi:hypothetical protein
MLGRREVVPLERCWVHAGVARGDGQHAQPFHGVAGIDSEVDEQLLELVPVGLHHAEFRVEFHAHFDIHPEQPGEHLARLLGGVV